jgi:DNA polymerase I
MPLIDVLAEMEYTGIRVDVPRLRELSDVYGLRLADLEEEIHRIAGRRFNIASPKQLAELLFTELNLPVIKRTKTGPSTDAAVLEELAKLHELPAKIVEYRQYAKLKGTYVDALPELVHPVTGRIHTSFNQVVAATGRLSSNDPNLQNIPIRTEAGREIRSAFVAGEPGWKLLAADYSQIELREMRRRAKAVNFGIIYGQTPFGLAKAIDIPKEEAAEFIEQYFQRYPGVEEFITQTLEDCRKNGYVKTLLGRRRSISGVRDPAKVSGQKFRNLAERTAVNTVIQGSAADIIKRAMIAVRDRLRREDHPARMLLQIHDELVFETPEKAVDSLAVIVNQEMSQAMELSVPLKVDLEVGENWAECEEYLQE